MNVSQYKPSNTMRRDAVESLSHLPLIGNAVEPAGKRQLKPGESTTLDETPAPEPNVIRMIGGARYECLCTQDSTSILRCETNEANLAVPTMFDGRPVTNIGPHAFSTCYSLEQIALPETVSAIGSYAFMNTALTSFEAPRALRNLGNNAFYKCAQLKSVVLNDELTAIGDCAFRESALCELLIPSSVETIGYDAFKNTDLIFSGLNQSLHIDPNAQRHMLADGALYLSTEEGRTLIQVLDEGIAAYDGPEDLIAVADRAFASLTNLQRVSLPEGVRFIGDAAFKGCINLTSVELPDSLVAIGKNAFWNTSLETLRIPASLESAGAAAFYTGGPIANNFTRTIQHIEVAKGNKSFYLEQDILCWRKKDGESIALLYTGDADRIVIPRNVTAIGPYAFLKSKSVRHLTIHDGIDFIDVGGLDFGRGIMDVEYLVYAGGERPVEHYLILYPPGEAGWQASRQAFSRGCFNLAYAYAAADNAILITQDTFNRSKAMLERLENPVRLDDRMRREFEKKIMRTLAATVTAFGRNGFPQGIDLLLDFGFLNQGTIDTAIEAASDAGEIAVLSRLMEIKRTSFDAPLFDFDL